MYKAGRYYSKQIATYSTYELIIKDLFRKIKIATQEKCLKPESSLWQFNFFFFKEAPINILQIKLKAPRKILIY